MMKILHKLKRGLNGLKSAEIKKARNKKSKAVKKENVKNPYFVKARSWADDIYTATIVSRNRYKMAFFASFGLLALSLICIAVMLPLRSTSLVVVHEGQGGYTWLSTTKQSVMPKLSWARTQSEIAHYVMTRESYDPLLYQYQSQEVSLLSAPDVQSDYEQAQSSSNKNAPINTLGSKGYRTVMISSILPLDNANKESSNGKSHINLAQVDYVVVDHILGEQNNTRTAYTALISWQYNGTPSDPNKEIQDWDGFLVTKFVPQHMNIANNNT